MSYRPLLCNLALMASGREWFQKSDSSYVSIFSNLVLKLRLSTLFEASLSHAWALQTLSHVSVMSTFLHLQRFSQQPLLQLHKKLHGDTLETLVQLDIHAPTTQRNPIKHTHTHTHIHIYTSHSMDRQQERVWCSWSGDGGF